MLGVEGWRRSEVAQVGWRWGAPRAATPQSWVQHMACLCCTNQLLKSHLSEVFQCSWYYKISGHFIEYTSFPVLHTLFCFVSLEF